MPDIMDIEDIVKEVEGELREVDLPNLIRRAKMLHRELFTTNDLDDPIQNLLHEIESVQANLIILRGMRIATKRSMMEAKANSKQGILSGTPELAASELEF